MADLAAEITTEYMIKFRDYEFPNSSIYATMWDWLYTRESRDSVANEAFLSGFDAAMRIMHGETY